MHVPYSLSCLPENEAHFLTVYSILPNASITWDPVAHFQLNLFSFLDQAINNEEATSDPT